MEIAEVPGKLWSSTRLQLGLLENANGLRQMQCENDLYCRIESAILQRIVNSTRKNY